MSSKFEAGKKQSKGGDVKSPSASKKTEQPAPKQEIDVEAVKQEAYAKGKKEGRLEVENTLQKASDALAAGLEELQELKDSVFNRSKEDMIRLVMGVAERVIQAEVQEKQEIVTKTVMRALTAAVQSEEYTVKIHPEDLEAVREHKPLFLARIKGLKRIHFLTDESISRGGCLAESRVGDVDATLETQLQEIFRQLQMEIAS